MQEVCGKMYLSLLDHPAPAYAGGIFTTQPHHQRCIMYVQLYSYVWTVSMDILLRIIFFYLDKPKGLGYPFIPFNLFPLLNWIGNTEYPQKAKNIPFVIDLIQTLFCEIK